MAQEKKELLLKDLCARLPYGVMCRMSGGGFETIKDKLTAIGLFQFVEEGLECIPYLRPMSSMTKEEKNKLRDMLYFGYAYDDYDNYSHRGIEIKTCLYDDEEKSEYDFEDFEFLKDFLLKNHLDYSGLIEKGLALEAPEGMYNI